MVLTMVYNTQNYWIFGLFPSSGILENTAFRKLHLHLRTETDPVSETYSLEYQMMEKSKNPVIMYYI
jgi:hypothetical protein